MTHILANRTSSSAPAWRDASIANHGNFSSVARLPWSILCEFEIFPNCRLGDDKLVLPERWFAATGKRLSYRTVIPSRAGIPSTPTAAAQRNEAVRRALLVLWFPRLTETGPRRYKGISWINRANLLLRMLEWQFSNVTSTDNMTFSCFTQEMIETRMLPSITINERTRQDCRLVIKTLIDAGSRGQLVDWPSQFFETASAPDHTFPGAEHLMELVEIAGDMPHPENWQPFSDEFVTHFVRRSLWIHENLSDQVLTLWSALREITHKHSKQGRSTTHPIVMAERSSALASFEWRDKDGHPLTVLPFPIFSVDQGSEEWPPRTTRGLQQMVSTIQAINCALIAFCTGARLSELSSAMDTPLQSAKDRFHSKVIKLVDDLEGKERDWPLHPFALRGLDIQKKLSRSVRQNTEKHLWVILRDGARIGKPLLNLTEPLVKAVEYLGLSGLTGIDRAHQHRWRHTIARLVALTVVGAPQVLLDLFGHRNLEMTLRYMLSDPQLFQDAVKVARETTIAMATDALVETIQDETGGPAAAPLQHGLASLGMRRGEDAYDTSSIRETAEILTHHGIFWQYVRPNVICTKAKDQFGPCTKKRGKADSGSCRTSCVHRLERAREKQSSKEKLLYLIDEYRSAVTDNLEMIVVNLRGQIINELKRWPEVQDEILANNPDIRDLWINAQ